MATYEISILYNFTGFLYNLPAFFIICWLKEDKIAIASIKHKARDAEYLEQL